MKFRTEIEVNPFPFSIHHKTNVVLMGSCFTLNIGDKLDHAGFQTLSNPFGITFNPASLCKQLAEIISLKEYSSQDLTKHENHFVSLQHHSRFNDSKQELILDSINKEIESAHKALKTADVLILSFGSAWVWKKKGSKTVVNNCHKIPAKEFEKELLSLDEIHDLLSIALSELNAFNPSLKVLFTVSPVRHWRQGAVENNRSKSLLLSLVHAAVDQKSNAHYFPSYEIMMDDLRDYRFYADDLLHPSRQAIEYIWEKFGDGFFSAETKAAMALVNKVRAMQNHKVMTGNTSDLIKFNTKLEKRISELKSVYGVELNKSK